MFKKMSAVALMAVTLGLFLIGCEKEGPAEKAGKKIDKVVNESVDKAERAGKSLQKQLDAIGKKVERHVEEAERKATED